MALMLAIRPTQVVSSQPAAPQVSVDRRTAVAALQRREPAVIWARAGQTGRAIPVECPPPAARQVSVVQQLAARRRAAALTQPVAAQARSAALSPVAA